MVTAQTGYYVTARRKVMKKHSDYLYTWFYYADGGGVRVEHRCGNLMHFAHSYTDPDMPTGGY